MKSRTRGPRHLNLGLNPAGRPGPDSSKSAEREPVLAEPVAEEAPLTDAVAETYEDIGDTETLIAVTIETKTIPTPAPVSAPTMFGVPHAAIQDALANGQRAQVEILPLDEPEPPATFSQSFAAAQTHAFAGYEASSSDPVTEPSPETLSNTLSSPLSSEMRMTESIPADDPAPDSPEDVTPETSVSDDLSDEALFAAPEAKTESDFAPEPQPEPQIRLDDPIVTPPPRPSTPVMAANASRTGRASKTKPQTPAARAPSKALAKTSGPGTVLKLSNASGVTYWGTTGLVSLTWVAGLVASSIGAETGLAVLAFEPFKLALLVLLAVLPLGLIFATAYALRHASRLAIESARAAAMADALVAPTAAAAVEATGLVTALREQLDQTLSAVRQAQAEMSEMGHKLQAQTEQLHIAAQKTQATTLSITGTLSEERLAISRIGETLDAQAQGVIAAVDRQARMVADASDLAQAQLREAEASLTSRATDLSVAASEVQETARIVSEDLGRQTQRLESAGAGVADQIKIVEDGLSQQRAGLVSAALSLRADQEDFAVHLETQRAQLGDALSVTRGAMVELGDASSRGIDLLRGIVVSAQEQLVHVLNAAENERTSFETRIHSTLDNISVMAADARDGLVAETQAALEALNIAAEDSRKAADSAAASAQARIERLNETLFDTGKKADEVFDARMHDARRLIEDSAALIDEAGAQTQSRLDEGFLRTRDTIRDVSEALQGLNAHAEGLPALAQTRIAEIRQSVEDGIRAMTEAARQAAQETEAVDQTFQDRVRRNYDMLSEAVRMMGLLSVPTPQTPPAAPAATPARPRDTAPRLPESRETPRPTEYPRPELPRSEAPRPESPRDAEGTRGRRPGISEPYAQSQPAKSVPPQLSTPQAPPAGRGENWSWSDLLKGIEGRDGGNGDRAPDASFDNLDDLMINEISGMGIDAGSLLGRTRMDETIAAILAEDNEGARLAVRRIAPAAVRRLTRRFVSDTRIRDLASQFIAFYDRQINVALLSNDARVKLHEILANDTGRAYLLIDAAISDII